MFSVIMRRLLWTLPTLLLISIITFTIIKLPPGDYLTSYITALQQTGGQRAAAAKLLGFSRVTLWKKMTRFDIDVPAR